MSNYTYCSDCTGAICLNCQQVIGDPRALIKEDKDEPRRRILINTWRSDGIDHHWPDSESVLNICWYQKNGDKEIYIYEDGLEEYAQTLKIKPLDKPKRRSLAEAIDTLAEWAQGGLLLAMMGLLVVVALCFYG